MYDCLQTTSRSIPTLETSHVYILARPLPHTTSLYLHLMSRRNRPTAFDLSFGESDAQGALKRDNLTDNNSPYAGRSAASAQRPAPPSSRLRNATRSSSTSGLGTQPAASSSRAAASLPSNRLPAKRKQAADHAVPSRSVRPS